jgi:hypothetical protein
MRILSATEAVSPAIARMKLLLFKPFRFGRSWKLAATGYLAGSSALFLPLPLVYLTFIPFARRPGAPASAIALIVAEAAIFLAIYFVIFYLCSRLSFAFLTSHSTVASSSHRRGENTAHNRASGRSSRLPWALLSLYPLLLSWHLW